MKKILSIVLALVLMMSLVAITASAEEPVTITVRSGWVEANLPNWRAKCAEFEAANPGIKIELEFTPAGEDSMAKLKAEFMSGSTPDIVQAWKTYFNEYVDAGLVLDISDVYESNGWKVPAIYGGVRAWCAALENARNDEAPVFGVPDFINTSVLFYNTKIFEKYNLKEPTNLDELVAVSKTLVENGVRPLAYPGAKNNVTDLYAKIQCQTAGLQTLLDINDGKDTFMNEGMLKAAQIVETLVKEGVLDPAFITYDEDQCVQAFARGEAAMFSMHTAYDKALKDAKAANPDFDYSIIKGVNFVDKPVVEYSATYGGCWMIPASTKYPDQAKKVLAFLFGSDMAAAASENGRITMFPEANKGITAPAIKVVVDNQLAKCSPESFYLIDMVPSKVLDNLKFGLQELISGNITPEQMMQEAQKTMDIVLDEK